ncbi:MAG: pyridoxamine 5'-phosphate oxidase family protein, partial [Anderseniella sp.]
GSGSTLRVNGKAHLSIDADLLASFAVDGKAPRSVIVLETQAVYFQCARAIVRSNLWSAEAQVDPKSLPTPGDVLAALTNGKVGGKPYDDAWWDRAQKTLW